MNFTLNNPGKFIVFEGIDGAGTTSQSKLLASALKGYWTKEPSNNPIGKLTREFLKDTTYDVDRTSMCLLFVADRIQHTKEEIFPQLQDGKNVICDRYIWSTLAYQKIYFGDEWLTTLHRYDYIDLPALTLVLDVELNVAESRRQMRSDSVERYDDQEIQKRVKENYLKLAKNFPDRAVVIDANKDFEVVQKDIYETVMRKLYKNELQGDRFGGRSS